MNFTETVDALAKKNGCTKKDAEKFIKDYEQVVLEGLQTGDFTVKFGNSGVWKVTKRAERNGVNPRTKEKILIPSRNAVVFRAGKAMSDVAIGLVLPEAKA
jgi:nucleoid DNA-binding protein